MTERNQRLGSYNSDELRDMWIDLDDKPGAVNEHGFSQGELGLELNVRAEAEKALKPQVPIQVQMPEVGGLVVEQPTHQPRIISDLEAPIRKPKADESEKTEMQTPTGAKVYKADDPRDALNGTEYRKR